MDFNPKTAGRTELLDRLETIIERVNSAFWCAVSDPTEDAYSQNPDGCLMQRLLCSDKSKAEDYAAVNPYLTTAECAAIMDASDFHSQSEALKVLAQLRANSTFHYPAQPPTPIAPPIVPEKVEEKEPVCV